MVTFIVNGTPFNFSSLEEVYAECDALVTSLNKVAEIAFVTGDYLNNPRLYSDMKTLTLGFINKVNELFSVDGEPFYECTGF